MTSVKYITECEQIKKSTLRISKSFFHILLQLTKLYYDPYSIYITWPDPHTTQCHTQLRRTRFEQIQVLKKRNLISNNTEHSTTNQRGTRWNINLRANIFGAHFRMYAYVVNTFKNRWCQTHYNSILPCTWSLVSGLVLPRFTIKIHVYVFLSIPCMLHGTPISLTCTSWPIHLFLLILLTLWFGHTRWHS
jgi:hypothetical protein